MPTPRLSAQHSFSPLPGIASPALQIQSDPYAPTVPKSTIYLFYNNVFCACISFALVLPSLWPYLDSLHASRTFLGWVVGVYSLGELTGSLLLGNIYNKIGARPVLLVSISLGFIGALMYGCGAYLGPAWGPWVIFVGRFFQGLMTGGQQAVETAYVGENISSEQKTQVISRLAAFACMGFIAGPTFGIPFHFLNWRITDNFVIDSNSGPGLFMALVALHMLFWTYFVFDGNTRGVTHSVVAGEPPSKRGMVICLFIFLVHFAGFAIQETIITPLVEDNFGWSPVEANYLYTIAGVISLVIFILLSTYLTKVYDDYQLVTFSLAFGTVGYVLCCHFPLVAYQANFLVGFVIISAAFPVGRACTISMYSKVIGPHGQGAYMGIIFTIGAISRICGPVYGVDLYTWYGPNVLFGCTTIFFVAGCIAILAGKKDVRPHKSELEMEFYEPITDKKTDIVINEMQEEKDPGP